jgi:pimeloyl-ACP methyl ester carboxylesterase
VKLKMLSVALIAAAAVVIPASTAAGTVPKPTIVLVHGAFADASTWSGVATRLQRDGYTVVAPAVPLRGLASDTAYVTSIVKTIPGPVVLVGHSYGGMLISQVAAAVPNVRALVHAAAFIPRAGESLGELDAKFPGSLLGPDTTRTIDYPGGTDIYIRPESFRAVFAADRSVADAAFAAASQRPASPATLGEPATATAPANIPDYVVISSEDKAIPPAAQRFMAQRAGAWTIEVPAAHDLPASQPRIVAQVIERAAH